MLKLTNLKRQQLSKQEYAYVLHDILVKLFQSQLNQSSRFETIEADKHLQFLNSLVVLITQSILNSSKFTYHLYS